MNRIVATKLQLCGKKTMSKDEKKLPWWADDAYSTSPWWGKAIFKVAWFIVGAYLVFCIVGGVALFANYLHNMWDDSYDIDILVTGIIHTENPNIDIVSTQTGKYELKMLGEDDFVHDVMRRHMHAENEYSCVVRGHHIGPWWFKQYLSYCNVMTYDNGELRYKDE